MEPLTDKIFIQSIRTDIGYLEVRATDSSIQSIGFKEERSVDSPNEFTEKAIVQLREYLDKKRTQFELDLNFEQGTKFQQKVWKALPSVTFGKTDSYLNLSKALGDVKAIRAVARANGANPFSIVIPCHRIIGSDGSLTGYAGGLKRKKYLLEHESPQQLLF